VFADPPKERQTPAVPVFRLAPPAKIRTRRSGAHTDDAPNGGYGWLRPSRVPRFRPERWIGFCLERARPSYATATPCAGGGGGELLRAWHEAACSGTSSIVVETTSIAARRGPPRARKALTPRPARRFGIMGRFETAGLLRRGGEQQRPELVFRGVSALLFFRRSASWTCPQVPTRSPPAVPRGPDRVRLLGTGKCPPTSPYLYKVLQSTLTRPLPQRQGREDTFLILHSNP